HCPRRLELSTPEEATTNPSLENLHQLQERAALGGGQRRIDQQHQRGKMTALERLTALMDDGTFTEIDRFVTHRTTDFGLADRTFLGDAVVTGYGNIDGRQVFAYAQDFTVFGGSLSEVVGQKICKVMDLAAKTGCPMIGICDSGGARIQEGALSLAAYGDIFLRNTMYSGVVPQISVIMGPSAGGAVYSPAITDFIFMVRGTGQMYITGPDVVRAVTGEDVTHEQLGGADAHAARSGVAHFVHDSEEECLEELRRLISFLPLNNLDDPPGYRSADPIDRADEVLRAIVPAEPNRPYDIREVIYHIVDDEDFMEVQSGYAPNVVVGFARMAGRTVGLVGNQPAYLAGVLDINASAKAARFVRFCDCFNVPLVTLVDVPGFMPGTEQEYGGIIRHGAKLIYAYAEATVPKVALITRKAYGGAYIVMSSKHLRSDVNLAWPNAEIAVMGPDGAVNIIYREEINNAEDPDARRAELIADYQERFTNPYVAANRGYLDDVIDPAATRATVIRALEMLQNKRDTLPPKKHGNIPL
ncbi:Propionyl-CoA carboxylase, carboxyltransferase subunit, partial [Geodia barretti]